MVTHDLPYALELCPRSVILDGGVDRRRRAAPGTCSPTPTCWRAHRLELPYGFDPDPGLTRSADDGTVTASAPGPLLAR